MFMYTSLIHLCMSFEGHVYLEYYIYIFLIQIASKNISRSLFTPVVEPARSRYSLHVYT